MKIKKSIQINGVDYTDKLLDISNIDIGVRDLGIGYISDITADLVFDSNLLDVKGQKAVIGLLVGDKSYNYSGVIRNLSVKNNKVSLRISHELSVKKFKPLNTYYSDKLGELITVPVLYGGSANFLAKVIAVDSTRTTDKRRYYYLLYGDKPVYLYSNNPIRNETVEEISPGIWAIKGMILEEEEMGYITHPYLELIESNSTNLYRRYSFNVMYNLEEKMMMIYKLVSYNDTTSVTYYGGKKQDDGSITYTQLPFIPELYTFIVDDVYDEIKAEYGNADSYNYGGIKIGIFNSKDISKSNKIKEKIDITIIDSNYKIYNPSEIIADILIKNGFSVGKKIISSRGINLNFQSTEDYKTIIQRVAEMGLLYVIPNLNNSFDIIPASELSSIATLSSNDFIENSFSIEIQEPEFATLKLIYNSGKNIKYYGNGNKEKEYNADYIVDSTSADTFAIFYLYHYTQKPKYISFSTPLASQYLDLDVGDTITVNYPRYNVNEDYQIIEKSIEDETIRFKCKQRWAYISK